jgi:hypothetical protein
MKNWELYVRNILFFISILISTVSFGGEITGRVFLEKTKQGLSKIPMRMHVYKDDYEFSGAEIMTDSSGRYRFPNLDTGEQFAYLFYPIYEGVNYPYQEAVFQKGETSIKKDFAISESTGSLENISASESISFEFGKKDIWKVTHEIVLENKGDLLYHSDRPDSQPILFSLFEGGFDLSYLDGVTRSNSKIDDQKDTLQVSLSLPPHDTYKMKFSYYYLPSSRSVAFNRVAYIARSNISLFFNRNVRVNSTEFQIDPMMLQGREGMKRSYTSGAISKDKNITFEIAGYLLEQDLLHILVLAACFALIALMIFASIRHQKTAKNQDKALTDRMLRYLIDLQQQHKEGKLDEHQLKKEEHRVRNFLFRVNKQDTQ